MSDRQELVRIMLGGQYRECDILLHDAICASLGHANWMIADLKGRISGIQFPNGAWQVCLDGKPLIEFMPLRVEFEGLTVRAVQEYRSLV